jgi:hypothetical protein
MVYPISPSGLCLSILHVFNPHALFGALSCQGVFHNPIFDESFALPSLTKGSNQPVLGSELLRQESWPRG